MILFNSKEKSIITALSDRFNLLKSNIKVKVTPKKGCDPKKVIYEDDLPRFYGDALSVVIATTPTSLKIVTDDYGNKQRLVDLRKVYLNFKKEVQKPIDAGIKLCYYNKFTGEEKEISLKIPSENDLLMYLKQNDSYDVDGKEIYYKGEYDLNTWGLLIIEGLLDNSKFMRILKAKDKKFVLEDSDNRTLYDKQVCTTIRETITDDYEKEIIYSYFTSLQMYESMLKELYKRLGKKGKDKDMEDRLREAKNR